MSTQTTDLWGDFKPIRQRTPLTILREQAALLGDKTGHVVEARVDTVNSFGEFSHSFRLVVPTLGDYTYELFRVSHKIDLYPVTARWKDEIANPQNEGEFVAWLGSCLSSDSTKRIIGNLLGQVAA